jgi:hypothetical protein
MEQKNDIEKTKKTLYIILTHPTILILNGTILNHKLKNIKKIKQMDGKFYLQMK